MKRLLILTALTALAFASPAAADKATTTRSDGYQVTLTGPTTAKVGVATTYTATCGPIGWYGSPCPYGEFRAFGGPLNRLGEGFGRGAMGVYVFRAAGAIRCVTGLARRVWGRLGWRAPSTCGWAWG